MNKKRSIAVMEWWSDAKPPTPAFMSMNLPLQEDWRQFPLSPSEGERAGVRGPSVLSLGLGALHSRRSRREGLVPESGTAFGDPCDQREKTPPPPTPLPPRRRGTKHP